MEKGKELKSTEGRDMEIRRISERSDEGVWNPLRGF